MEEPRFIWIKYWFIGFKHHPVPHAMQAQRPRNFTSLKRYEVVNFAECSTVGDC
jgi:hypothetical protein